MQGLTPQERRGVIVIAAVIALAGGIRLLQPFVTDTQAVDYRAADSVFTRISMARYVAPPAEQARQARSQKPKEVLQPGSIDINRAGKSELVRLPRIGPAIASRIIAYREAHGRFSALAELKNVRGIGEKTFANIRPYLKELDKP